MNKNIHQKSKQAILPKIKKAFIIHFYQNISNFIPILNFNSENISNFPLFFKRFFNK